MEQQAKERLTGAVILVALLVLLVPELLTGPRHAPPPAPVQPDQAPMRSYTIDLGDSAHANSSPVAASTAVVPATSEPAPVTHAGSEPVAPAQTATPPAAVEPAKPMQSATAEQGAAAETRAPTATAAVAPSAGPAEDHVAEHGAAAWTVQMGTFSSRVNAVHLVSTLKSQGFTAVISEATKKGHKLFRVRVGTEKDRAAAQKLLGRLKSAGEKGGEVVAK